ncbi:ATP-dependent nuclease [Photobacterium carnosum]|uniref:ATP-dependent nuclease n=1 Tax=Photobacterium carnosum TaxID=2023717 RepID=UPI001E523B39|nr:AAA family ATPase [Photobacterium carnosum]MCD9537294.1 AAA family ATPase [Photobacterium carnosum]MCF2161839.1 AAA family ATPase [Photobacterium carnosum]
MHKIDWVRIRNFRSCSDVSLNLEKYSPLVGYNNAGKSNILKAIKWFLRPTGLAEKDFNDKEEKVIITAKISGITDELLNAIDDKHKVNITPYINNESMFVRLEQKSPGGGKTLRKLYVSIGGENDEDMWKWNVNPNGLQEALHDLFPEPIFVQSMDNATDDVSKFKTTSTIGKLLQLLSSKIENEQHELIGALDVISRKLNFDGGERLSALDDFDQRATQRVQDFFPGVSIKVHIPTPSLSKLFTDGTIKVQEVGRESSDVDSLGHGAQRSIQMALIRLLAEVQTEIESGQTTLLLIDEPELYLHPQAIELVRDALKLLSNSGYQIVFTTHSALMVEQEDVPNTSIVRKNDAQQTVVSERIAEAIQSVIDGNVNQARILFEIYNMSQILFADRVLIAEGATELSVLPALFKACNRQFNTHKTALVIAEGCAGIHKMGRILNRIGIPFKALVDLDYVFTTARTANLLASDDPHLMEAIPLLSASSVNNNFELDGGVLPKKTGHRKAYEAYELFADSPEAIDVINELHNSLKAKNYWLWTKGAIEKHLSLDAKTTGDWISFKLALQDGEIEDVLEDYPFVSEMTIWATS